MFSESITGQADKWNMSSLMSVSMSSVNRCMGVCCAQITSSNDIVPTAMKAWPEECPPLVFSFLFFLPPPNTFSLNVGYMQLTHKRQKWSSLNPMLQSINSPTSASFQLMLQPLSHKRSPHPQFYYNLTKIRQPLAKPQWKASWESALGTQEGWKCLSCGLVTTLLGWRPSWQRRWLVTDRAGSG